jgi:hypothetical protein
LTNNLFFENRTGNGNGGYGGEGGDAYQNTGVYTYAGDGGNGGSGNGGKYIGLYNSNSQVIIKNSTMRSNYSGYGIGGIGGEHGSGNYYTGFPGTNGQGFIGNYMLGSIVNSTFISNTIIYQNVCPQSLYEPLQITYSCITGGYVGIGNINSNPQFVSTPIGNYFLSQISAGQPIQSPCVNTGCPDSLMITGTTRTDGWQDTGIIDMGFHYPCFNPPIMNLTIEIIEDDIRLTWSLIPEATIYKIYRNNFPHFSIYNLIPIGTSNAIEYIDIGAIGEQDYFYRVTWE